MNEISIFTPITTYHDQIKVTYKSLVAQTCKAWEWVIIDGSNKAIDGGMTSKVLAELSESDLRVKVIKNSSLAGGSGAMNHQAARLCRGDFLVEVCPGDTLRKDALTLIIQTFKEYDADFVYSNFTVSTRGEGNYKALPDGWGKGFGASHYERINEAWALVVNTPDINEATLSTVLGVPTHLRAWRASFYVKVGGHDPDFSFADDYKLILETVLRGGVIVKIPLALYEQCIVLGQDNSEHIDMIEITSRGLYTGYHIPVLEFFRLKGMTFPRDKIGTPYWEYYDYVSAINITTKRHSPGISVVLPVSHKPDKLKAAIDSVLGQTCNGFELLVVSENYNEDVSTIVRSYRDARVKYYGLDQFYSPRDHAARNYAVKMLATGAVIAYLDEDKTWIPTHLESLIEALDTGVDFSFGSGDCGPLSTNPLNGSINPSALAHRTSLFYFYGYWKGTTEVDWDSADELLTRWTRSADPELPTFHQFIATKQVTVRSNKDLPVL